jgi:hypothetical protein
MQTGMTDFSKNSLNFLRITEDLAIHPLFHAGGNGRIPESQPVGA